MAGYDFERSSDKSSGSGGCRCSTAVGFLLVLLAVAIAVGVGLIVHFAEKSGREVTCNVELAAGSSADEMIAGCTALARGNHRTVCEACSPRATTTTKPATTSVTITTTQEPETTTTPAQQYPIRLPGSLVPVQYSVWLKPDFYSGNKSEFKFEGRSSVVITCLESTSDVIMHLKDLNIVDNSIVVREENSVDDLFDSYFLYEPSQLIVIKTKAPLTKGRNYVVEFLNFWAPIRVDFSGLYLGEFKKDGKTSYHVASQLEPTDARTVFPCFDEPAMKTTFDVTIMRKSHVTTITNMPVASSSNMPDNWVEETFEQTPIMSTYLLAFIIGEFTESTVTYKNRFPISIWSREDQSSNRQYALDVSQSLMEHFENFFGAEYDLPKQDMVAMLSFPAGAMENWGAFVFQERYLLYQEGASAMLDKYNVVAVIAHELAHNWFGNVVSPAWWDDLWLNEAFAYYMETVGTHVVEPEMGAYDLFITTALYYGMAQDEQVTSHPVYIEGIEKPAEINAVFDAITYLKGAHLVRMLNNLVGDEMFASAMQNYITDHAYGNADHNDLWTAVHNEEAAMSGNQTLDIVALMSTWVYQMGFPTVTVSFSETGKLRLTQSRYIKDRTAQDPGIYTSEYGYKWDIPFTFTSSAEQTFDLPGEIFLMNHTKDEVVVSSNRVPSPTGDNWVIGNLQNLVFMRINYDQRNWDAIIKQLKTDHTVIHLANRIQLMHDVWNLAKTGEVSLDTALRVSEYIRHEREFGPWLILAREQSYISGMLLFRPHHLYGKYYAFLHDVLGPAFDDFDALPSTSLGLSTMNAKVIIMRACVYGVQSCRDKVASIATAWMTNPDVKPAEVGPEIAPYVYCYMVKFGGVAEWEFMLQVYQNSSLQSEQKIAISALGCTEHRWLQARFLSMVFKDDVIATSDNADVIYALSASNGAQTMMWDWLRENWNLIITRFSGYTNIGILDSVARNFNTEHRLRELEAFIAENQLGTHPVVMGTVSTVRANIEWMENSVPILEQWLTDNGY